MKTGSFDVKPQSIQSKFNISEGHEGHDQIVVRFILPLLNAISIFSKFDHKSCRGVLDWYNFYVIKFFSVVQLPCFIQNVHQSMLLLANKTIKDCIQFLIDLAIKFASSILD
jgi:hypothetical protein